MNADWTREFNPAEPFAASPLSRVRSANKKPRGGEARGKGLAAEDYFFAKISFAHCDLWFDAELR